MPIVSPDPETADVWVPPFPIQIMEQLQEVSTELAKHPELTDVKADVDRAISRLQDLKQTA
jgi:hypothetical protein